MPLKASRETSASGEGYYTSSVFSARDLLENIAGEIDNGYTLEEDYPSYVYESKVFKVTVTVEEV
jgi:hypothetical protein